MLALGSDYPLLLYLVMPVRALVVGVFRTLGVNYFPEAELAIPYLIAAVVLLVRPAGLFGSA